MADLAARAAAGAAFLDRERPGWWRRLDLSTLDMNDSCKCVIAQEYASDHATNARPLPPADYTPDPYWWAVDFVLELDGTAQIDLGFFERTDTCPALRTEWTKLVEGRRRAEALGYGVCRALTALWEASRV